MHVLNDLFKCNTCHMVYYPNSPVRSKLGGIVSHLFKRRGMSSYTCCFVVHLACTLAWHFRNFKTQLQQDFPLSLNFKTTVKFRADVCKRNFDTPHHWLLYAWRPILFLYQIRCLPHTRYNKSLKILKCACTNRVNNPYYMIACWSSVINILQVFIINLYFPCLDTQYRQKQYKHKIKTKVTGKPKCLQLFYLV